MDPFGSINKMYENIIQELENEKATYVKNANEMLQQLNEYKKKKAEYEAKKQELEPLVGISCLDRMDYYYNRSVEAMQKASTEDEYKNIAEQFRSLEGYKDSIPLADKCGKLVIKVQYDKLIQEKTKATTEEKYRELSKRFRKMGGYENSAQLADECNKLADECVKVKEREKKAHYDNMVKEKSGASSEYKFNQLAQEFREMGNYENAVQLANECEKQSDILKKQREEQERQEKARLAAQEAREQAERERKEAQKRREELAKNILGSILVFATFIYGLFLYYIAWKEIGLADDLDSFIEYVLPTLIGSLIFIGIPIALIYYRILIVIPIIVFLLTETIITFAVYLSLAVKATRSYIYLPWEQVRVPNPYFALIAMGAALIMALVYPKLKKIMGITASVITVAALGIIINYSFHKITGNFFDFQQNSQGTLTVTKYSGGQKVIIPATYNGVNVTEIGDNVFYGKNIMDVTIPDGITSIGASAFKYCDILTSITIPDSVTSIGNSAFSYCCDIVSVTIPDNVTSIEESTFYGCARLASVTIGNSVTKIENFVFKECARLTSVTFAPNSKVTSIGNNAFGQCTSLANITIPNGVTSFGGGIFDGCTSLTSVTIPNSVTSISGGAFHVCTSLVSITIPNRVTSIGTIAFFGCTNLASITIPASVTRIEDWAFRDCNNLTRVTFESKNISLSVFNNDYPFEGDLHKKYQAGGAGTYTRPSGESNTWTKRR